MEIIIKSCKVCKHPLPSLRKYNFCEDCGKNWIELKYTADNNISIVNKSLFYWNWDNVE